MTINRSRDLPGDVGPIKQQYEAALGKFLVAFNRIEGILSRFIKRTIETHGLPQLAEYLTNESFAKRMIYLQVLAKDDGRLADLPFREIIAASEQRNSYAHGHFDLNPFDGTFDVVGKRRLSVDVTTVLDLAASTESLASQLEIRFWFEPSDDVNEGIDKEIDAEVLPQ